MARPTTLVVVRTLLLGNGLVLTVVGALVAGFVDDPHPLWLASGIWAVAIGLFAGLRWTDPYTRDYPP
jgi:hypothetical protein